MAKSEETLNKRRVRNSYITSVISTTLVLFMLGVLAIFILYAKKLSIYVRENIGFSVIIKEDVKEADIMMLKKTLDTKVFTKTTEYITKEKAAEVLSKELGEDFLGFLGYNPLLSSIDLRLNADYANNDSLAIIEKGLLKNPNVKEVFYQKSLVHLVNENVKKISLIILGFSIVLLLIAVTLINNTIRLTVYARRFLIKTMQLVGATGYFIRKPFIISGIIQGIISSIISIILLFIIIYFLSFQIPELINLKEIDIYLIVFGIVILLGFVISWVCTFFAVRKYLNIKTDKLYI